MASDRITHQPEPQHKKIFNENPYDIESFFEALSIASDHNKELIFVDRFISLIRTNPKSEVTTICYDVLHNINILK